MNGNHYFIEMNPRIQVEHTVTEMTLQASISYSRRSLIAEGYELNSPELDIQSQDDVQPRGFAIQCRTDDGRPDQRICAGYRRYRQNITSAGGYGIRLDAGNAFVSATHLAVLRQPSCKSNCPGCARFHEAIEQGYKRALTEMRLNGVKTNSAFPAERTESPDVSRAGTL